MACERPGIQSTPRRNMFDVFGQCNMSKNGCKLANRENLGTIDASTNFIVLERVRCPNASAFSESMALDIRKAWIDPGRAGKIT